MSEHDPHLHWELRRQAFHAPDCRYLPGVPYLWCTYCDPVSGTPVPQADWWHPQGPKAPPDRGWIEMECACCGHSEHQSRLRRVLDDALCWLLGHAWTSMAASAISQGRLEGVQTCDRKTHRHNVFRWTQGEHRVG